MKSENVNALCDDVLDGMEEIAQFTGIPVRRCFYLAERKMLHGVFKQGARWTGLKSVIHQGFLDRSRGVA